MGQQVDSVLMKKYQNNPVMYYLLVLCLSLALILSQTNRLHMHLQHDDLLSIDSGHIADVHTTTIQHDMDLAEHHNDHHVAAIDINTDNLVKKTHSLNPLLLLLLVIGLFLFRPLLISLRRPRPYQTLFTSCYYLLHPPLRAPPVK